MNKLSLITLPLLLAACSSDPNVNKAVADGASTRAAVGAASGAVRNVLWALVDDRDPVESVLSRTAVGAAAGAAGGATAGYIRGNSVTEKQTQTDEKIEALQQELAELKAKQN